MKEDSATQQELWTAVDGYVAGLLEPPDPALEAALRANGEAGLPAHDVAPNQGMLLHLLARAVGARSVLEIGTLGGYSTIWLARALPEDGRLISLEVDEHHAEVARRNLSGAGLAEKAEVRVGDAKALLALLVENGEGPFDFIFIDADKPNNPSYLAYALELSRSGTLIIGDNVAREGEIVDASSEDPKVRGVRRFFEMLADEPRLSATAIQTVGSKGYDGFALALVTDG